MPASSPFEGFEGDRGNGVSSTSWPAPKPLPDGLLPVPPSELDFLPASICPGSRILRSGCNARSISSVSLPPLRLGSVIGRKIGVRPQRLTDWIEVPNLVGLYYWKARDVEVSGSTTGACPLHRFESEAREDNDAAAATYAVELESYKLRKEEAAKAARASLKAGKAIEGVLNIAVPEQPKAKRYITNDATYESLGVILSENPLAFSLFGDELIC